MPGASIMFVFVTDSISVNANPEGEQFGFPSDRFRLTSREKIFETPAPIRRGDFSEMSRARENK